jgi:hypothetical protein
MDQQRRIPPLRVAQMKIRIDTDDKSIAAHIPFDGADHVLADEPCACGSHKVMGRGNHIESHDTYAAEAFCGACPARRATLRVTMSTIFGIEEDERVLNGRARVY